MTRRYQFRDNQIRISDLELLLTRRPWLTQKVLVRNLAVDQRLISRWLRKLNADVRLDIDPDNGRANVKTYAITDRTRRERP